MSYHPELVGKSLELYDFKIGSNGLRKAVIGHFDYVYDSFQNNADSSLKAQWPIRQFLVKFSGIFS
jgi:hypothetical protein